MATGSETDVASGGEMRAEAGASSGRRAGSHKISFCKAIHGSRHAICHAHTRCLNPLSTGYGINLERARIRRRLLSEC